MRPRASVAPILPVLLAVFALAGCDDGFGVDRFPIEQDTVALYSLSRPELVGFPAAYDFFSRQALRIENAGATGNWDVAVGESGGGFVFVPPGVFPGLDIRAGVSVVENRTYEQVTRAPSEEDAYVRTELVELRQDVVYVLRTRRLGTCVYYAKLRALEQDPQEGRVRLEFLLNPNCGDRSLVPDD